MTELEKINQQQRDLLLPKNLYNEKNGYSQIHPNALSTGDEPGKGETDTIGGKTDILTRVDNLKVNKYNTNKNYPDFTE